LSIYTSIIWPNIFLLSHFFFKNYPNLVFVCCMPSFVSVALFISLA
jgi:hypothetical protein